MKFHFLGNENNPPALLLHGGGLGVWSLEPLAKALGEKYFVVTGTIDGHGEESGETFVSIEKCASKTVEFVLEKFAGKLELIYGLSLGAQIALETLCQENAIAKFAFIESALVYPLSPRTRELLVPSVRLSYPLISSRLFAKAQAKSLGLAEGMFEDYFEDSKKMSRESLVNITISNANYDLPPSACKIESDMLILTGEKEIPIMAHSARRLKETVKSGEIYVAPKAKHGELSLLRTGELAGLMFSFMAKKQIGSDSQGW